MLARMTGFSWKPAANQRQEMLRFHIYAQEVTPKVAKEIRCLFGSFDTRFDYEGIFACTSGWLVLSERHIL